MAKLFNSSKIYLYDSAQYWAVNGLTEGFGLPPLEALACGCMVFSSVNHALADYLDPAFNCQKISGYAVEYDVQRILKALESYPQYQLPDTFLDNYREDKLLKRLEVILTEINAFFDVQKIYPPTIEALTPWRIRRIAWRQNFKKLITKIRKKNR